MQGSILVENDRFLFKKSHDLGRWEIDTIMSNLTVKSWHISGQESLLMNLLSVYTGWWIHYVKKSAFSYMTFILRTIKVKAEQNSQTPLWVVRIETDWNRTENSDRIRIVDRYRTGVFRTFGQKQDKDRTQTVLSARLRNFPYRFCDIRKNFCDIRTLMFTKQS